MVNGGRDVDLHEPASQPQALPEREMAVLDELAREGDALVAFQGLRRRLGLHQEILSRTLRRLETSGLVEREVTGYRLTEEGFAALRARPHGPPRREVLSVAQALLPPDVDERAVTEGLSRRWFHGLRWYGRTEGPGETTLLWLTEPDDLLVRVRLAGGAFALEIESRPGRERRAFAAARAVLMALAELYGLDADRGPVVAWYGEQGFAG